MLRMWRLRRSQMEMLKRFWQSLKLHLWPNPRLKGSLFRSLKEVHKFNTFATIVESNDTQDPITINFMPWRRRILKDKEDKERGIGTPSNQKGKKLIQGIGDVMRMIDTITSCLTNFTQRFENHNSSTQSSKDITPNARTVWVKKGTRA